MSKHLVLGAGGFIGQHLVRRLADNGADEIVAFDRFSRLREGAPGPFDDLSNVSYVLGDFLNRDEIDSALNEVDYVFHLVSTTTPAASNADPFIDIDTNVRGSVELFELCVKHNVKKVIFPSSGGTVYGDVQPQTIGEKIAPQPRSPYGIGKLTIEHFLRFFKSSAGLDYIVYRIANPYGPGQNIYGKQGVIPIFMHKFLVREPVTIYGDGSMVRDYVYIDDLVSMIINSYAKPSNFNEYNLGCGKGESVNTIYEAIARHTGYHVGKKFLEIPATFVQKSILDISRYEQEFDTFTFTTLDEGLERTWAYVKELN